jgi:hypothetical protein
MPELKTRSGGPPAQADQAQPSRVQIAIWATLLLVAAVVTLAKLTKVQVGLYGDDAYYVLQARALLQPDYYGQFAVLHQPNPPTFPPGYPLVLAPLVAAFPSGLDVLRLPSLVATLLSATLLFWGWPWLVRGISRWWALGVTALFLLSRLTIEFSRMVMSEAVFGALCLATVLLTEQVARGRPNYWRSLALGMVSAFAIFTRSAGFPLVATVVIYLWLRQGKNAWRAMAVAAAGAGIVMVLAAGLTHARLSDLFPTRYVHEAERGISLAHVTGQEVSAGEPQPGAALPVQVAPVPFSLKPLFRAYVVGGIVQSLGLDLRKAMLPVRGSGEQALGTFLGVPQLSRFIGYLLSGIVILGYVRWLARKGLSAFALFGILYAVLIFFWAGDPRFYFPILPQLYLALLMAVDAAVSGVSRLRGLKSTGERLQGPILASLVAVLAALAVYRTLTVADSRFSAGDFQGWTAWLVAHTPSSARVTAESAHIVAVYAERDTIPYPANCTADPTSMSAFLSRNRVDYVLVAPQVRWQESYVPAYSEETAVCVLPAIEALAAEGKTRLVYTAMQGAVRIYQTRFASAQ